MKKVGSGIGVGTGIKFTTGEVIGDVSSNEVRIVTIRDYEGAKETKHVSSEWWEHVQNARDVRKRLGSRYNDESEVRTMSRGATKDKRIGDHYQTHVKVYVEDVDNIGIDIPDEVDGIEVRTLQYEENELEDCNQYAEDPLPGGLEGAGDASFCTNGGTWCCRMEDIEFDTYYMLHCAHAFDVCDSTDDDAFNRCQKVGEGYTHSKARDAYITQRSSDDDLSDGYSAFIEKADHGRISGHVTKDGIEDILGQSNETVYKMGIATCETTGYVEGMERCSGLSCASSQNCEFVSLTNDSDGGDSGGPYYRKKYESDGDPYIAMLGTHSRKGSIGIAAYEVHNWSGLYFR